METLKSGTTLCIPPEDTLLKLKQLTPNLEKHRLSAVYFPLEELLAIMRHMGSRLQYFETSIHEQNELGYIRLERF